MALRYRTRLDRKSRDSGTLSEVGIDRSLLEVQKMRLADALLPPITRTKASTDGSAWLQRWESYPTFQDNQGEGHEHHPLLGRCRPKAPPWSFGPARPPIPKRFLLWEALLWQLLL